MTAAAKIVGPTHFESRKHWLAHLEALPIRERREVLKAKRDLDYDESALYLGMKVKTLYNLISLEQGPENEKIGASRCSRCRFSVEALERWDRHRTTKRAAFQK